MPTESSVAPSVEEFRGEAVAWLRSRGLPERRDDGPTDPDWGTGSDNVAVFHDLSHDEELELIRRLADWQRTRFEAGFGAITWPTEYGGRGLSPAHADAYAEEELRFETPSTHELVAVTVGLVAPTIRLFGTPAQRERFVRPFLTASELACQLFSEPGAGSDLANLGTRAVRDGDDWVVTGQKVWTSGAQYAQWGELIARTDAGVPKHQGMTAFLVPLDAPGVTVRPLRQMSGGSSFNEVFLDEVRIPDAYRLGEVGQGWKVALTTLGFERGHSGRRSHVGGHWRQAVELARWAGADKDPVLRQQLADVVIAGRLAEIATVRDEQAAADGAPPGAIGSMRKLRWVTRMTAMSDFVREVLGPRLVVDTGEWGTFAWSEQVLGAPGYRIAGGSDEIQRNIIGERVLGLPAEPRTDRNLPWREVRGA
jgi:alkylation response protein AidB-like acyl-CoA dehydrogenase